jgi:hypothetical protein
LDSLVLNIFETKFQQKFHWTENQKYLSIIFHFSSEIQEARVQTGSIENPFKDEEGNIAVFILLLVKHWSYMIRVTFYVLRSKYNCFYFVC